MTSGKHEPKVTLVCVGCGKEFTTLAYRARQGQRACKRTCRRLRKEVREQMSNTRQQIGSSYITDELRLRRSEGMKRVWKDPEQRKQRTISRARSTRYACSAQELALVPLMSERGFQHTGDGKFFVTGKDGHIRVPDFVNRAERKIFELWGDYWHRGENPQELVEWYRQAGWEAEVRWISELQARPL